MRRRPALPLPAPGLPAPWRLAPWLLILAVLPGCASLDSLNKPIEVTPAFRAGPEAAGSPSTPPATCDVEWLGVTDARRDPADLGAVVGRDVHVEQTQAWLQAGVRSLAQTAGVRFVQPPAPASVRLTLRVELVKASTMSLNMAQVTSVALRATYGGRAGASESRIYRGDTANGWLGLKDQLNTALNRALAGVARDLRARCQA